jgi:hypothetical protein
VGAVYLGLRAEELSRLPRFDPAGYRAPDWDGPLPVPYRREDIALAVSGNRAARRSGPASPVSR